MAKELRYYSQNLDFLKIENFIDSGFKNIQHTDWHLCNLKPINLFIGGNNSGKSRLIRLLFINSIVNFKLKNSTFHNLINEIFDKIDGMLEESRHHNNLEFEVYNHITVNKTKEKVLDIINSEDFNLIDFSNSLIKKIDSIIQEEARYIIHGTKFAEILTSKLNELPNYKKYTEFNDEPFEKIYIPLLRGLRTLGDKDFYQLRTINDYFSEQQKDNIFTGHSLYNELQSALLGTYEQRLKIRDFEEYLSRNFFQNKELSLVPRIGDNVIFFKEGSKDERPIYDLGDGIQSIIIITFKIFMATKPTMFFIEEPEKNLHPSMQRILIDTLSSHPEHMYFMTTHSNHFLDISQENNNISIQRVYQEINASKEITIIDSLSKQSQVLLDLGVRPSSVLLANCSIWVEGITDKLYLKAYLRKYIEEQKEKNLIDTTKLSRLENYKENLHFIFTEYQGSNITHWYFGDDNDSNDNETTKAKSLNSNILLIADADINGKSNRVESLNNNLDADFILLKLKEIENYIPKSVLKIVAKQLWDSFNEKGTSIFNEDGIEQLTYDTDSKDGIGHHLETLITPKNLPKKDRLFFKSGGKGTIKNKKEFCLRTIKILNSNNNWELGEDLTKLCEQIWNHIDLNNYSKIN
ncbi:ATP-dependent nuclease [Aliivibrio fischeri]|uniref:ATP-dependent nuclease n=1 Tax=Aliivibrio fischeri TaxID=668 RepID=UPI00105E0854|nr:ATP-binding protein [Aliivibrio fischeri]TDM51487.1 ATP-binding protein [Aliivibrio fischeri]